jgi:hypothetical protein
VVELDPAREVDRLAAWRDPYLIGVRHHSPVLAAAVPSLMEAAAPDLVLIELPEELQPWLGWLADDRLVAPVALAAARRDGEDMVFYPYADFSPELAAVRWARTHGVVVRAFDLPVGLTTGQERDARARLSPAHTELDADDVWDRLVEARSPGAGPEAIRRAALAVGWGLRLEHSILGVIPTSDLVREAWMRQRLAEARVAGSRRCVAVVGAYHGPALLETGGERPSRRKRKLADVVTSLVPYDFALLDSRTGYPAGIRDPEWQQSIWEGGGTPEAAARAVTLAAVRICRELRRRGHPAGVPDAREVIRMASDLARLRGLPAPGRRELVEALQSVLAQGEPWGRGRAVAAAMQGVLVGRRRGRLAEGTPRSGLGPHIEKLMAELRLPGPGEVEPRDVRLDPLRSELDRRRHVALNQLRACEVPYAHPVSVDDHLLTGRWVLRWTPATSATIELLAPRGVTLAHAAEGTLRMALAAAEAGNGVTARLRIGTLRTAAECGLAPLVVEQLADLERELPHQASLPELIEALELCERLAHRHVPGLDPSPRMRRDLTERVGPTLAAAAVVAIEGLTGSNNLEDAHALLAVAQCAPLGSATYGDTRLRWALEHLEQEGSPLMQGASGAVRVLLGQAEGDVFGERMASWLDASGDDQNVLARRLSGVLTLAAPLLEAAPEITSHLIARIGALDDSLFLRRLPALREGFDVLSPAARQRFLGALRPSLSNTFEPRLEQSPKLLARWAEADFHGRQAIGTLLPEVLAWTDT